jgi:hypothetical protein
MWAVEAPISGSAVPAETSSTSSSAMSNDAKVAAKSLVLMLIADPFGVMTRLVFREMILCIPQPALPVLAAAA